MIKIEKQDDKMQTKSQQKLNALLKVARGCGFSNFGTQTASFSSLSTEKRKWILSNFNARNEECPQSFAADGALNEIGVITACLDYLPKTFSSNWQELELVGLKELGNATISITGRGRSYYTVLNEKLKLLSDKLSALSDLVGHRFFVTTDEDDAVGLAINSGLGWQGKHSILLNRNTGSTYFICQIYVDFALPGSSIESSHCGSCRSCIDICPTQAIVSEGVLDVKRCISYLTIEHDGPVSEDLRPLMGNRIYGCDDCQLICPWNKFATRSSLNDFDISDIFKKTSLLELWEWSERDFFVRTENSPIRRLGFGRWQRNIAIAIGNTLAGRIQNVPYQEFKKTADLMVKALKKWQSNPPCSESDYDLVAPHVEWALNQLKSNLDEC